MFKLIKKTKQKPTTTTTKNNNKKHKKKTPPGHPMFHQAMQRDTTQYSVQ